MFLCTLPYYLGRSATSFLWSVPGEVYGWGRPLLWPGLSALADRICSVESEVD